MRINSNRLPSASKSIYTFKFNFFFLEHTEHVYVQDPFHVHESDQELVPYHGYFYSLTQIPCPQSAPSPNPDHGYAPNHAYGHGGVRNPNIDHAYALIQIYEHDSGPNCDHASIPNVGVASSTKNDFAQESNYGLPLQIKEIIKLYPKDGIKCSHN